MTAAPSRSASTDEPGLTLDLAGTPAVARPSGALWLPEARMLVAADLHLGKSDRLARLGGPLLPPYETIETLRQLGDEIAALAPRQVVSLGDAFDDDAASERLEAEARETLLRLMAGRRWFWVRGNHDPSAPSLGGEDRVSLALGSLILRHEAAAERPAPGAVEISGHFHPKVRLSAGGRRLSRRCFLWDDARLILPAFGAYTGGLDAGSAVFDALLAPGAQALCLSGPRVLALPRTASA